MKKEENIQKNDQKFLEQEKTISNILIGIVAVAILIVLTWCVARETIATNYGKAQFNIETVCEKCGKHMGTRSTEITILNDDKRNLDEKLYAHKICDACKNLSGLDTKPVSSPPPSPVNQPDCRSDDEVIATEFFNALKNREYAIASNYCEAKIIDDRGIFGLWGQSYSVDYVCSAIGSRIDDKWIVRNGKPEASYPDERIILFADTKYKDMQNAVQRNGEWYLDGNKKIISSRCIAFAMHQINGQWKIYRIADMQPYIFELE